MDLGALKDDVVKVIKHLPTELQVEAGKLFHLIGRHMPLIEKVGPTIVPLMMPHIQSGAMEFAMGIVDKTGIEKALREAFTECGIAIPELPTTTVPHAGGPST